MRSPAIEPEESSTMIRLSWEAPAAWAGTTAPATTASSSPPIRAHRSRMCRFPLASHLLLRSY